MDRLLKLAFLFELQRQSRFALMSAADLRAALEASDLDRLWYAVQSLLVAVGNVSKILWPTAQSAGARGSELRALLGADESSPLAPRTFRNHFEHFDERLETWAKSTERRNIVDSSVGPPGMIVGVDTGDFLRNFNTQANAITYRGDIYNLVPVVDAVRKLEQSVSNKLHQVLLGRDTEAV